MLLRSELQGNISSDALQYLVDEVCRVDMIGTDKASVDVC
jgi:hypothetical protein